MSVTFIRQVVNTRDVPVTIKSLEEKYGKIQLTVPPKSVQTLPGEYGWGVPWAESKEDFPGHHIKLASPAGTKPFCIWQHDDDGDTEREGKNSDAIRYSTDGQFHSSKDQVQNLPATKVAGDSIAGWLIPSIREIRVYTEELVIVSRVSSSSELRRAGLVVV